MWDEIKQEIFNYIKTIRPTTAFQVSKELCPHAIGTQVGGVTFSPSTIMIGNRITSDYCDRMQFLKEELGIDFWLRAASKAYHDQVTIDDLLYVYAPRAMGKTLPIILYQPFPESYEIRLCNIHELIHFMRIDSVMGLLNYLVTFIAFGIYIDENVSTNVLRLENPQQFIAARLFQGKLDVKLARNNVSAFIPFQAYSITNSDIYSGNDFMEKMSSSKEIDPQVVSQLIRIQENTAANATFVDNSTDMWKVLHELKQSNLPPHYMRYLQHDPGKEMRKVGLKHFSQIVEGKAKGIKGASHQSDFERAQENIWRQSHMKTEKKVEELNKSIKDIRTKLARIPLAP